MLLNVFSFHRCGRRSGLVRWLAVLGLGAGLFACQLPTVDQPGTWVPPTAGQDPALPQLAVTVAGYRRVLHLQTFGNPTRPVAFVLPGGPGADFRLLLPLQALSDRYFVVMWDPRGAGLSERVTRSELTIDSFLDEIDAVWSALAPGRPVTLIGHSWGANLFLRYTARYPERVSQLVLIEPGGVTKAGRDHENGGAVNWFDGQDFFWQNQLLTSSDHAAADYKAVSLLPGAYRNYTCTGERVSDEPIWRFGAYQYYVLTQTPAGSAADESWLTAFRQFAGPVLIVAGTCGANRADFQSQYVLPNLPGARLETVPGAGHISLFLTHREAMLQRLRAHLLAYP
ncbi:alpha/beta fold hydrolase [Fibrella aquatilis]|uniref:Alpha/beta hydrolase n=1 Tax=Fibrella aquatilis TaxID=2817059 RepID=A0A939G8L8_9BACT|nr:alpha/beta hydrolase [Fibrella aquatilis]MBO0933238.1 alpha/beta hydrolase [Fibrella aquatilis]